MLISYGPLCMYRRTVYCFNIRSERTELNQAVPRYFLYMLSNSQDRVMKEHALLQVVRARLFDGVPIVLQ